MYCCQFRSAILFAKLLGFFDDRRKINLGEMKRKLRTSKTLINFPESSHVGLFENSVGVSDR